VVNTDPTHGKELEMSGTNSPRLETLRQESYEVLCEATAERSQRLVRNVVLLGATSRNGYRYSPAAMQAALPLYENRPIFLDHADEMTSPTRRKLRDFAGQVLSPRYEGERLRGDLRLLGPHADWLFDLIEAAPQDIGMSHVVLGRRGAGELVEHIERVVSVDIVAFPATTRSFQESMGEEWVTKLLAESSLSSLVHSEELRRLISVHPEPGELLRRLEEWSGRFEKPVSPARTEAVAASVKESLVAAIRG
jgi:hypothetical protein